MNDAAKPAQTGSEQLNISILPISISVSTSTLTSVPASSYAEICGQFQLHIFIF